MKKCRDSFFAAMDIPLNQAEYDPQTKTCTLRCAVCGKEEKMKRPWYRSRQQTFRALSQKFRQCKSCRQIICMDCFLVDDGDGGGLEICTDCAKKQGVTGLTIGQFEKKWPEIFAKRKAQEQIRRAQSLKTKPI